MLIRDATAADSSSIARVQVDSFRTAYVGLLPATYLAQFSYADQEDDWRELIADLPPRCLFVATNSDGEILGYALGKPIESANGTPGAELVAMHVRKAHHRQGAGRRLVAAVARRFHGQGCAFLRLTVLEGNPASGFYECLGGKRMGVIQADLGDGVSVSEIIYEWSDIEDLYQGYKG